MVKLSQNRLVFRFPGVHADAECAIEFERTLRIPDDNQPYPLPPGLGAFALNNVDDYSDRAPDTWRKHGGVFLPMHQAEAMWINFSSGYPMAVKVAAGMIDALTGEAWRPGLTETPQNYVVIPEQPWLDGFCVGDGRIRQFVAMPLGAGYSAEEQLTREAAHGGLQLVVYPMKAAIYETFGSDDRPFLAGACAMESWEAICGTGIVPRGVMEQEVYEDPYGFDAWETQASSRCFVHLLNSLQYQAITGSPPPSEPPAAKHYTDAGLPWFQYYAADRKASDGGRTVTEGRF